MYFKRLEMHGFKSFADPVAIDFHEGITCVVGPNGSGKSNISDAIKWVLGEQSSKALRGGKMEEVIFSGTAGRKARGMAEVILTIDNSQHLLAIDYREVSITRRMYRSGESEYLINGNPCRLRDIRDLIADTGIGVDGYSIIGQGKIADIVNSKAEARREIFEDAAGVVRYKTKREEAGRKLESTQASMNRVEDILAEIGSRLDGLREESEQAEKYLALQDRYTDLETNIILRTIENLEKHISSYAEEDSQLGEERQQASKAQEALSAKLTSLDEQRNTLDRATEETRDDILSVSHAISEAKSREKVSAERRAALNQEEERLEKDKDRAEEQLAEAKEKRAQVSQGREEVTKSLHQARARVEEALSAVKETEESLYTLTQRIEEENATVLEERAAMAFEANRISSVSGLKASLLARRDELEEIERKTGQSEEAEDLLRKKTEAMLTAKKTEKHQLDADLEKKRQEEKDLKADLAALRKEGEALRIDQTRLTSRHKTLCEMEANYEGYQYAVRTLMRHKPPGIEGLVADRMQVPAGLEVAVEMALGSALQHVIVRDEESAQECIRFLKQTKAGRLTFLPVSSLRASQPVPVGALEKDPDFLGLASNLVRYDSKYRNIYTYLLGRTAIVKNMEAAFRLAGGKGLRFVSLEGEVLAPSGAITGGSYRIKTANILERKGEIGELTRALKAIDEKIKGVEKKIEETEAGETLLKTRIEEGERQVRQVEVLLAGLDAEYKEKLLRSREAEEDKKRREKERENIRIQMEEGASLTAGAEKKIEEARQAIREAEEKIGRLQEEKEELTALAKTRTEALTKARIKVKEEETKQEERDAFFLHVEKAIRDAEKLIEEKESLLTSLREEKKNLLADALPAAKLEEKEGILTDLQDRLSHLGSERDACLQARKEAEEKQKETEARIEALRDRQYQLEIRRTREETQKDNLKTKLWDAFAMSYAQAADRRREDFSYAKALRESRKIQAQLQALGSVNVGAIEEYRKTSERYRFLEDQRKDIIQAREELFAIIRDMDSIIRTRFQETFDAIMENFESIFRDLFGGGKAELALEDPNAPLNSGIEIIAQPPGKKLQNINLLSGGEKTMTAIALMFAVLKTKPTPFCILDEVEAALDDVNINKFGAYLRNFANIQFTLITHQKQTMEHADVLYGVTMPEKGVSELLNLRL